MNALVMATWLVSMHAARAAEPRVVELEEVRELARSMEPEAQLAAARAVTARRRADVSALAWIPEVAIGAGYSGVNGATQSFSDGLFDDASFTTAQPGVQAMWSMNPFAVAQTARSTRLDARAAEAGADATALTSERRAVELYFALAFAEERVRVAAASLEDAEELVAVATAREAGGTGRGEDAHRATSEQAIARVAVADAEEARFRTAIQLAYAIGVDPAEPVRAGRLEGGGEPVAEQALGSALERRPELTAAARGEHAARAGVGAAWSEALAPDLWGAVGVGGLGPDFATLEQRETWSVGLRWSLSASDLGRARVQRGVAEEATVVYQTVERQVRADVADALASWRAAEDRAAAAGIAESEAEAAWSSALTRYDGGLATFVDVVEAKRTVDLARLTALGARVRLASSRALLVLATGG